MLVLLKTQPPTAKKTAWAVFTTQAVKPLTGHISDGT